MTPQSDEQDIAQTQALLRSGRTAVFELLEEIEGLKREVQNSSKISDEDARKTLMKLREAINQCIKTENFLNDCRSKQDGLIRGGHAFDLDQYRSEIGRKLDRLRESRSPRAVSEGA